MLATAAPFAFALHPDWAEADRVTGSQFRVDRQNRRLVFVNSFPGLDNGDFEAGHKGWFDLGDAAAQIDANVVRRGRYSGVVNASGGNARFRQKITLKPWRQYHIGLSFKTSGFGGFAQTEVLTSNGPLNVFSIPKTIFQASLPAGGSQEWTNVEYTFNSRDATEASLYFGVWGGSSGTIWFDDVYLEETALVYVMRNNRAPFRAYDPSHASTTVKERSQIDFVSDPRMSDTHPFYDSYHTPPVVKLPRSSNLPDNAVIAMDYYAVFPIPRVNTVAMCLSDHAVLAWLKDDAKSIRKVLPRGGGIMMQYDEIRQMNSCAECRAKNMSAGQLLAWNVGETIRTFQSIMPEAPLYTWSDMFDPYHNAVNDYFYVEGDLAGSWKGLPSNVTIMNWNLDRLHESLAWFSGSDSRQPTRHDQIIAGFYDRGDAAVQATSEIQQAKGIAGVQGVMYTTWTDDYSQLEKFANAARQAWPAYLAGVPH